MQNTFLSRLLLGALLATSAAMPVFAQNTNTPRIDQRETAVRDMIDNGYRNGSLTRDEARSLQRRRLQIERREARLKSKGGVTPDQRQQLREELDDLLDEVNDMIADHRRGVYSR